MEKLLRKMRNGLFAKILLGLRGLRGPRGLNMSCFRSQLLWNEHTTLQVTTALGQRTCHASDHNCSWTNIFHGTTAWTTCSPLATTLGQTFFTAQQRWLHILHYRWVCDYSTLWLEPRVIGMSGQQVWLLQQSKSEPLIDKRSFFPSLWNKFRPTCTRSAISTLGLEPSRGVIFPF